MHILLVSNTGWSLANFREGLIRTLIAEGHRVTCVAPVDHYAQKLLSWGACFVSLPMDNKGTNPWRDLMLLMRFLRLLRLERPDVLITYTIKPNIYGSLAAQWLGVPTINVITGLGTAFVRGGWLEWLVRRLYRLALRRSRRVFFLNPDDYALFVQGGLVSPPKAALMPGSGVNTSWFSFTPLPPAPPFRFLLTGRLLWDKGVGEFVEASRRLQAAGLPIECQLLGFIGVENPSAIAPAQIAAWEQEGVVRYLGSTDDVRPYLAQAHCIVLPSYYREGVPRALLEAAAMGRPIITTDTVGCREVVENRVTGFLCRPRDAADLADAMRRFIELSPAERQAMGIAGRQRVVEGFDESLVIDQMRRELLEVWEKS